MAEYAREEIHFETVAVLESHIDHLTGEELGHAFIKLQEAGAVDVLWLPGVMKKNRPGGALRAVCLPSDLEAVQSAFFRHTHTLGIRRCLMERVVLPRKCRSGEMACGNVPVKCYEVEGVTYTRAEFEALVTIAAEKKIGLPALRFQAEE